MVSGVSETVTLTTRPCRSSRGETATWSDTRGHLTIFSPRNQKSSWVTLTGAEGEVCPWEVEEAGKAADPMDGEVATKEPTGRAALTGGGRDSGQLREGSSSRRPQDSGSAHLQARWRLPQRLVKVEVPSWTRRLRECGA